MATRVIRPMTFSDIDRVAAIERATFTIPWSTDLFMGQLRRSTSILLVCEIEGVVVAYLIADSFVDVWHIMNIAVDVPHRGDHIASELIEAYFAITEQSGHAAIRSRSGSPTRPRSSCTAASASSPPACAPSTTPTTKRTR